MRFLVDLYRIVIIGVLALILIGVTFLCAMIAFGSLLDSQWGIPGIIGLGILCVASVGFVATFVSIHDRLAEIALQAARIADCMSGDATEEHS